MRLLIVQYAGDYRDAFRRFANREPETYYAQQYSVDAVAQLADCAEEVATLCCLTEDVYDEVLQPGLRAMGAGLDQTQNLAQAVPWLEHFQPTHLVLRSPIPAFIRWAIRHRIPTLMLLADSFEAKTWRQKIKNRMLAGWLNHPSIEWVGNHGIEASLSLEKIGVRSRKIIPWDWIYPRKPEEFLPKQWVTDTQRYNLFYVGAVILEKGVGDLLEAIAQLKKQNFPVNLKIAGKGEIEFFVKLAQQLEIERQVEFLGIVPNRQIIPLMHAADAVVVPSRHEYPEGFPCTIYEALTARTPLIASDHPMFRRNLGYGAYAAMFPAGDAIALADQIQHLFSNPQRYAQLSEASAAAWEQLQLPVKWADLLYHWIWQTPADQQWFLQHRLHSGQYTRAIAPPPVHPIYCQS